MKEVSPRLLKHNPLSHGSCDVPINKTGSPTLLSMMTVCKKHNKERNDHNGSSQWLALVICTDEERQKEEAWGERQPKFSAPLTNCH